MKLCIYNLELYKYATSLYTKEAAILRDFERNTVDMWHAVNMYIYVCVYICECLYM